MSSNSEHTKCSLLDGGESKVSDIKKGVAVQNKKSKFLIE